MPKLLSLLLCFAMVFSLLALPAQAAKADASSVDGTYIGTGAGRNGDITLSVTIADGKITQIENVSNKETPKYWAEAVKLFDSILAANGTDGVDAVSGATLSSDGILAAVDDALAKASSQLSGSGTEADPYVISGAAQLQAFAALVDAGNTYAGQYVALGADIDLSGVDNWNPIGAEAKSDTLPRQAFFRHVRRPRSHGLRAEDPGGGRCERDQCRPVFHARQYGCCEKSEPDGCGHHPDRRCGLRPVPRRYSGR